jgi:hypothetical protein
MSKNPKVLIGGKGTPVTLKKYIAQGGEGSVYEYQGMACKIYHDPASMIPEQKILELGAITLDNVLAPKDIIYNPKTKKAIGFTMPFMQDTEYLVRLFSRKFKNDHGITPEMAVNLVKNMQETLDGLHKENIVVGDYNEMNFLTNSKYTKTYNIDVDSYQTKTFPCTAIMDSIRDRTMPFGKFQESSDWFSWAVVTFQLYTGIHPFKGRHPDYSPSDMDGRMKNCISVFDKQVKMPKVCQDFSIVPKAHLEWYKNVFDKNERSMPPWADGGAFFSAYVPIVVATAAGLKIDLVHDYDSHISDLYYYNGNRYVITQTGIYKHDKEVFAFTQKPKDIRLGNLLGEEPVIAVKSNGMVGFLDMDRNEIGRIASDDFMVSDGSIYTMKNGDLIENYFEKLGKVKHLTKAVSTVVDSSQMFRGVVFQDVFGKAKLSIPYEHGKCANIDVSELDGYRIIDAKRIGRFCITIGEKKGKFDRIILYFNERFTSYETRGDADISYRSVNLMVKQNGMAVTIKDDDTLEMFYDIKRGSKEITDCPVEATMPLYDGVSNVLFTNDSKLQSAST